MHIITLKSSAFTADINLTRGANCIRLRHLPSGTAILREPDYAALDNPFLYGMPVLFPANRISGASFPWNGRQIALPLNEPATGCHIHGTLHETPFALESADETSLTALYRSTADAPCAAFPFAFTLRLRYTLDDAGLTLAAEITNDGAETMPLPLAFHTTFNADGALLQDAVAEAWERDENYLPTGRVMPLDDAARAIRAGSYAAGCEAISRLYRVTGRRTTLTYDKLKVVYENDEAYRWRLTFSSGAGFICLEPMTNFVDALNADPTGMGMPKPLAPGETRTLRSRIFVE